MGAAVVVPEGESDRHWLILWQRVLESAEHCTKCAPLSVIPTQDGEVVDSFIELRRFRPDALPFVDGDPTGDSYVRRLLACSPAPRAIIQLGTGAAIETLSTWILEPCMAKPGPSLSALLSEVGSLNFNGLRNVLSRHKKEFELREDLAWEASENPASVVRVAEFLGDMGRISSGEAPVNPGWKFTVDGSTKVYRALHICKP